MPQLEISTYLTQIFWVLLTFICFWLVMDRFIIPGIAETIDARKRKYDDYLLKAERVNKKALASLRRYEETLAAAKAEAASQIKKNEDELKNMIAEREEDINRQLKEKIVESEAQLLKDKEAAMSKIEEISQAAAYAVIQKLGLESSRGLHLLPEERKRADEECNAVLNGSLARLLPAVNLLPSGKFTRILENIFEKGLPEMQREILFLHIKKEKRHD